MTEQYPLRGVGGLGRDIGVDGVTESEIKKRDRGKGAKCIDNKRVKGTEWTDRALSCCAGAVFVKLYRIIKEERVENGCDKWFEQW